MQLSRVFRVVLLLYLITFLLDVVSSKTKNCKRKEKKKCSGAGSKSKGQNKIVWVPHDATQNNQMRYWPSPDRSLSPWTYTTSFDNSRIPSKISEAKCEKRGCLTKDGEEDLGLESKPIYFQINVLRRVKGKNASQYNLKLETKVVSVGCTCVLPIVVPQN